VNLSAGREYFVMCSFAETAGMWVGRPKLPCTWSIQSKASLTSRSFLLIHNEGLGRLCRSAVYGCCSALGGPQGVTLPILPSLGAHFHEPGGGILGAPSPINRDLCTM